MRSNPIKINLLLNLRSRITSSWPPAEGTRWLGFLFVLEFYHYLGNTTMNNHQQGGEGQEFIKYVLGDMARQVVR